MLRYAVSGQLKSSFSDAPELARKIDRARFTRKSLISLTSEYHEYVYDGEQCIIYSKPPPAMRIGVGPAYYKGITEYERIYTCNQQVRSWNYVYFKGPSRQDAGSYSIADKLYFFGGPAGSGDLLLNDVWMYDMSQ